HKFLRRDGGAAGIGVQRRRQAAHAPERLIGQLPNGSERMVRLDEVGELGDREQRFLSDVCTAHPTPSTMAEVDIANRGLESKLWRGRISTSCYGVAFASRCFTAASRSSCWVWRRPA